MVNKDSVQIYLSKFGSLHPARTSTYAGYSKMSTTNGIRRTSTTTVQIWSDGSSKRSDKRSKI